MVFGSDRRMRKDIDRRNLLKSALCLSVLGGCGRFATQSLPVLKLAIGQSREFIDAHSTLPDTGGDSSSSESRFIITPHQIVYEDAFLKLRLPDCGALISMPTVLSFGFHKDVLESCQASVLGDYVDVATAADKARELTAKFLRQGFRYVKSDQPVRLASLEQFGMLSGVAVPAAIADESGIEAFFLNPDYCVGSILVFQMISGPLLGDFRMVNMRRRYSPDLLDDPLKNERKLSDRDRRNEKAYYLELDLSANDWISGSD